MFPTASEKLSSELESDDDDDDLVESVLFPVSSKMLAGRGGKKLLPTPERLIVSLDLDS